MSQKYQYNVDDVAEMFKVNPETVRRWCRDQYIQFLKLPGAKGGYRFSEKCIDGFVAKMKSCKGGV